VYPDQQGGTATIEWADPVTSGSVPAVAGTSDILPDVSGGTIVFTRLFSGGSAIYEYAIGGTPVEVDPIPTTPLRRNPAIGGATIAWEDSATGASTSEIVVRSGGVAAPVTSDGLADRNPNVSPDGSVVVWEKCSGPGSCDVYAATASGGSWAVSPVSASGDNEISPDSNSGVVVYSRGASGAAPHVYYRPVGGGPEQAIAMPPGWVDERRPAIAGDVVVFVASDGLQSDIWAYDLAADVLAQLTKTPENESLPDVGEDSGTVRVAWQVNEGGDVNVYATHFAALDTVPPVLTVPGTITVPATGPDGAVVTYTATAADDRDPSPTMGCSPASGSTFPIGTTTVHCDAADASGNTSHASFMVTVKGAVDQLNDLIALVDGYGLPGNLEKKLRAKLRDAIRQLAGANPAGACRKLTEFLKEVDRETGQTLTKEQAEELNARAEQIKVVIGC
jgi:hypothetical protein